MLREAVIVVSREQPQSLFQSPVIGQLVLIIHVSPVPFDVAVKGFLDEVSEVGIFVCMVINSSRSDKLSCVKNGVDYEQSVYGYTSFRAWVALYFRR